MRVLAFILAVFVAILAAKLNRTNVTEEDLRSVATPLAEQKRAVLLYLRDLECRAHSPCFYASVDGGLTRDPKNAFAKCLECDRAMKTLTVPTTLPRKVRSLLEKAQDHLARDVESLLNTADSYVASIEKRPRTTRRARGGGSTCEAYALISKVTKAYGIDSMMRGKYVDCDVLSSVR